MNRWPVRCAALAALLLACDPSSSARPTAADGSASAPSADSPTGSAAGAAALTSADVGSIDSAGRVAAAGDAGAPPTRLGRPVEDGWIERELRRYPERFDRWLEGAALHRLQILVSVVEGKGGARRLRRHGYRPDAEYVYPASAIKPLLGVAALISLRRLAAARGVDLDPSTPLAPCLAGDHDCRAVGDPSNLNGGTLCVAHAIRKLLLVSDNEAFATLYDLVGQRQLNAISWELGLSSVRFHHRMNGSAEAGRRTPGTDLLLDDGTRVHLAAQRNDEELPPTAASRLQVGHAHLDAQGRLHAEPMSFAQKNYASLSDLQDLLVALVLPDLPGAPRLGLGEEDRQLLVEALTLAPSESKNPRYAAADHPVGGHKPLLPGVSAVLSPERIRHLGKAGHAYGFQIVNAYIEDRASGRALFVTASLYVNPNGIVNDDRYDYDGSTRPFMRNLGEALTRATLLAPRPR